MGTIILAIILLGLLWWWFYRRGRLPGRSGGSNQTRRASVANAVPSHLMRKLDHLTRDPRVSERLIERIEFNNPGKSKRWCAEKAIYDIQRDRRS